ncbi:MAG: Ig domain-containing protein, partial [Vicinamibacterales bacterium]
MPTTPRLNVPAIVLLLLALLGLSSSRAEAQLAITACPGPSSGSVLGVGLVDSLPLSATGGSGPYTWTLVGGSLPPGLSIRTDVPPFITDPTATAVIAGVATTAGGPYNFTVRVTSNAVSFDQSCSLSVSSLVFKNPGLPHAFVNQSFSATLVALRDGNQVFPTWSVNPLTPLPAGISLNSATGELSGTPSASGVYSLALVASDGGESVGRSISLQVFDVGFSTSGQLPNATQGQSYSTQVFATGGTGSYTYAASGLPQGLSMNGAGEVLGIPTLRGPASTLVTAIDSSGRSYSKVMSIDVIGNPSVLPSIVPGSGAFDDCTVGVPCSRVVNVTNGGRAPFSWSAAGLPPGMSIRSGSEPDAPAGVSPKDVELWGTVVAAAGTTYGITFTVTDADGATATNTFPLRVSDLAMALVSVTNWTVGVPDQQRLRVLGGASLPALSGVPPDGTNYGASILSGTPPLGIGLGAAATCASAVDLCGTPQENISTSNRLRFTLGGSQLDRTYFFSVTGGGSSTIGIGTPGTLGAFPSGMSYSRTLTACCAPNPLTWSVIGGAL